MQQLSVLSVYHYFLHNFSNLHGLCNSLLGMKDIIDEFRTEVLGLQATGIRSADRHILRKQKYVHHKSICLKSALLSDESSFVGS